MEPHLRRLEEPHEDTPPSSESPGGGRRSAPAHPGSGQNDGSEPSTALVTSASRAPRTPSCSEEKRVTTVRGGEEHAELPRQAVCESGGPRGPGLNGCPGEVSGLIEDRLEGDGNAFALRLSP